MDDSCDGIGNDRKYRLRAPSSIVGYLVVGAGGNTYDRTMDYREGGDEALRALGSVVDVGQMAISHVCITKQKYVFKMILREQEVTMTFTCNDPYGLTLSGPVITRKKLKTETTIYTGGPTWENSK